MADKNNGAESDPSALSIVPEVLEAVKQEHVNQININILLARVSREEDDPDKLIERTEKLLALTQKFEDHRLKTFQQRSDAIIDIKTRDPDEIEKRHNNRTRRCLKFFIAGGAFAGFGGATLCVVFGSSIVVAGVLATGGALSLAMLGPLATGESVSSSDIVRIVNAIRGMIAPRDERADVPAQPKRKKR